MENEEVKESVKKRPKLNKRKLMGRFMLLLYTAVVAYSCYYIYFCTSDRYTSVADFTITKSQPGPSISPDSLMSFLPTTGSADSHLVIAYIHSTDLILHLEKELKLFEHYSSEENDQLYRLATDSMLEERIEYYREKILPEMNVGINVVTLKVEAFSPKMAMKICSLIISKTEDFINELNKDIAKERLKMVFTELNAAEKKLFDARKRTLQAKVSFDTVDLEQDLKLIYKSISELEGIITEREAQLEVIKKTATGSPKIKDLEIEINFLKAKLAETKKSLTGKEKVTVNKLIADLKEKEYIEQIARISYDNSLLTYNTTRLEGISQSRFFSTIQTPFLPEKGIEPRRVYLVFTIIALSFLVYVILSISLKSIMSH